MGKIALAAFLGTFGAMDLVDSAAHIGKSGKLLGPSLCVFRRDIRLVVFCFSGCIIIFCPLIRKPLEKSLEVVPFSNRYI